ncbi:hypothetical protein BJ165DRAFT_1534945 [Panaeolus papilionaceus]|nr:hypothetical protein BJ165DRAFT_1534945 [Panaeolus papilionaceus]
MATINVVHNDSHDQDLPKASESYPTVRWSFKDNPIKEPPLASSWISNESMKQMLDHTATEERCAAYFKDCPADLCKPFVKVTQYILEFFQLRGVRMARDIHKDLLQYEQAHDDNDDPDNVQYTDTCVDLMALGSPAELNYSDPAKTPRMT